MQEGNSSSCRIATGYHKVYVYSGSFRNAEMVADGTLDQVDVYSSYYQAGCEIDWVYDQYKNNDEVMILNEILGDDRAHLELKKNILQALGGIFYSSILVRKFIERYGIKEQIDFIPAAFPYSLYRIIAQKSDLFPGNVKIPGHYIKAMQYREAVKNIVYRAKLILYPFWTLLKMSSWGGIEESRRKYNYGVHIWDSWISSVSAPYRMSLLEGDNCANPRNTLYIIDGDISEGNLLKIKSSGYDCCCFGEMIRHYSAWKYLKENILLHFKLCLKSLSICRNGRSLLAESYLRAMQGYIVWDIFYSKYYVDVFITLQEPGYITRSLVQKSHGARCLFIFWSTSYDYVDRQDMCTHFDSYYSHMIYDDMISSYNSIEYFKKNNNFIEKYVDIGIMRSDIIFRIKHDAKQKLELKGKLGIPSDKRIIGLFDTSTGNNGIFTNREGSQMFDDMYHLLESDNNYFMIFRSRVNCHYAEDSGVRNSCNRLVQHKRVLYINSLPVLYFAFEVAGVCDLVVGGFTESAPLESLSGGIRTLCYTPAKFDRDIFVLNNVPRFCVHNYDELKRYADYWLYSSSEKDFHDFQEAYIKKYVDHYCDGNALKRLHSLLGNPRYLESEKHSLQSQLITY